MDKLMDLKTVLERLERIEAAVDSGLKDGSMLAARLLSELRLDIEQHLIHTTGTI